MAISITVQPYITEVEISESKTEVVANLALVDTSSNSVSIEPTGTITATNLQDAIAQLAAQDFRQSSTPTGSNIEEGDTWYNTNTEQLYVYRETSPGTHQWTPIIVGNAGSTSDSLDGGAF